MSASERWNSSTSVPIPWAIRLSPRYMTKLSPARKSRAMPTAWARPSGASWAMKVTSASNFDPSPTAARTSSAVSPTMIPMSWIPAWVSASIA